MSTFVRLSYVFILLSSLLTAQDINNATGEYYFFTDQVSQRSITCTHPSLCFVQCYETLACYQATITASSSETLILQCITQSACSVITVIGPTDTADVQCVSQFGYACGIKYGDGSAASTFGFTNTKNVNIVCDQQSKTDDYSGSCYKLTLWAQNAETVSITCANKKDCEQAVFNVDSAGSAAFIGGGDRSLYQASIIADSAGTLSVECHSDSTCRSLEIHPPWQSEYAFSLLCISYPDSCFDVDVKIPSSTARTTNFMEMICPRTDEFDNICDIDFFCDDLSTSTSYTSTIFSSKWGYICTDTDCCPWTDNDNRVQSTTVITSLPNAISPTDSNATTEWYVLDSAVSYRMISCSKQACFIECMISSACYGATVYAGVSDYLSITCGGTSACSKMYITEGPSNQADIFCSAKFGASCRYTVFILSFTSVVNLLCSSDTSTGDYTGNCFRADLWADESITVNINCEGDETCYDAIFHVDSVSDSAVITGGGYYTLFSAYIYADSANYLEINCNAGSTCRSLTVYPPYSSEHAFKMYCAPHTMSCSQVSVTVPLSTGFIDNYMELICPRTDTRDDVCDIKFHCTDLSSYSSMTFCCDDKYVCSSDTCCPWPHQGIDNEPTSGGVLPNSMTPTLEDETGQYYTITSSSTDLNEISCTNPTGCYIKCTDTGACASFVVYAGDTDYLQLICSGTASCSYLYITEGPNIKADINCTAIYGASCYKAPMIMYNTETINLFCYSETTTDYSGGCFRMHLWSPYGGDINIHCLGYEDCYDAEFHMDYATKATIIGYAERTLMSSEIYARYADRLNMECIGYSSCYSLTVYPPYDEEYIFRLTCADVDSACWKFTVELPSDIESIANNYMSLRCPDYNDNSWNDNTDCDIEWICNGYSSDYAGYEIKTDAEFMEDNNRYECKDDDCCPWQDHNYMVAPKECTFIDGKFCGYSLFVKGFDIFKLELSGNSILDVNQLEANTESWTDEGGSCSLSTLEFAHSYSSYSSYAEADATNIAGSYSSGDNAAGGSLSSARTSAKSYAAQKQSYIYTMDLLCTTATASIVAANQIYWNENFVNNLRVLPTSYDSDDADQLEAYIDFWNSYGTHIMKTAKLGGLVRGSIVTKKCDVVSSYGDSNAYEICLNGAYKGVEVDGCGAKSRSSSGNNSAHLLVSNTQIDVKGGNTASFSGIFNEFKSKSTDFQSWIDDIAPIPDIIGGNLDEIHDVILNALNLGNHRLNDDLSSSNQLTDTEWQDIANALKEAYTARSQLLSEEDLSFSAVECEISCSEGKVDKANCECTGCGGGDCCDGKERYSVSLSILVSFLSLYYY